MLSVALLALLPNLFAHLVARPGSIYLGSAHAFDDHMVYAAWMHQSMEGRFFFENLFAPGEGQPSLTVNLFFWLLGKVALFTGIIGAATLARVAFSALFVWLLSRLLVRSGLDPFQTKLTLAITVFGGGLGVLVWHNFGRLLVRPETKWASPLTQGWQSNDVWQPEMFVMPSVLTNGLFMMSLCLMLLVIDAVIRSKESWKPVMGGVLAFGVLMNVHSYDVLTLALAFFGLLVISMVRRSFSREWLGRVVVISLGVVPAAAWFIHVLRNDPVFQARAATPTPMSPVAPLLWALLPLLVLGWVEFAKPVAGKFQIGRTLIGLVGFGAMLAAMQNVTIQGGIAIWVGAFGIAVALAAWMSDDDLLTQFMTSWALTGLVAPYFPAEFQRKLAAGLVIPWAYLAALGLHRVLIRFERGQRNMVSVIALAAVCLTSVLWVRRELSFIRDDVSSTTTHAVFLSADTRSVLEFIRKERSEEPMQVVVAMPGVPAPGTEPDTFTRPIITDLNPVITGLTGARTVAGHWSETPDYNQARSEALGVFLEQVATLGEVEATLEKHKVTLVVVPNLANAREQGLRDISLLGPVVYSGSEWLVVRVDR